MINDRIATFGMFVSEFGDEGKSPARSMLDYIYGMSWLTERTTV